MASSDTRIHVPGPLQTGDTLALDGDTRQHLRARRLRAGDTLTVFDGTGGEYHAWISHLERRHASLTIDAHHAREAEPPQSLVLMQGIAKGDRMDLAVQKAVELGVSRVVPVFTRHTVVRLEAERAHRRRTHWQRVATSACEQCGRNRVPTIDDPVPLAQAWSGVGRLQGVVLDPEAGHGIHTMTTPRHGLALLVGPEGGLSAAEVGAAAEHGFTRLALGPRVLRTETATLAAIALLQAHFGDMG